MYFVTVAEKVNDVTDQLKRTELQLHSTKDAANEQERKLLAEIANRVSLFSLTVHQQVMTE